MNTVREKHKKNQKHRINKKHIQNESKTSELLAGELPSWLVVGLALLRLRENSPTAPSLAVVSIEPPGAPGLEAGSKNDQAFCLCCVLFVWTCCLSMCSHVAALEFPSVRALSFDMLVAIRSLRFRALTHHYGVAATNS